MCLKRASFSGATSLGRAAPPAAIFDGLLAFCALSPLIFVDLLAFSVVLLAAEALPPLGLPLFLLAMLRNNQLQCVCPRLLQGLQKRKAEKGRQDITLCEWVHVAYTVPEADGQWLAGSLGL